jgi:hypothetical protein
VGLTLDIDPDRPAGHASALRQGDFDCACLGSGYGSEFQHLAAFAGRLQEGVGGHEIP